MVCVNTSTRLQCRTDKRTHNTGNILLRLFVLYIQRSLLLHGNKKLNIKKDENQTKRIDNKNGHDDFELVLWKYRNAAVDLIFCAKSFDFE